MEVAGGGLENRVGEEEVHSHTHAQHPSQLGWCEPARYPGEA